MAYIGLDLGSTYTKIALLNRGQVIKTEHLHTPPRLSGALERYEVDADDYYKQVLSLLELYESDGRDGILLSTQMHGYVLTDAMFKPLTPYVSWQDRIGGKYLSDLAKIIGTQAVAPSGVPLKANLALCSLWGRMREGYTLPNNARLCTLGGYIISRLTGAYVCHMTNAAPTGMADIRRGQWNRELISKAGFEKLLLPDIRSDLSPIGVWRGIPVYPDMGDQQVCAAGAHLTVGDTLHVNVGTAGLIGVLSEHWEPGDYENRPWLEPGIYLRTVSGLPGGRDIVLLKEDIQKRIDGDIAEDEVWRWLGTLEKGILMQDSEYADLVRKTYTEIVKTYGEAANRLNSRIAKLSFSGGCVNSNPLLRECFRDELKIQNCTSGHDITEGFLAIIAKLEG